MQPALREEVEHRRAHERGARPALDHVALAVVGAHHAARAIGRIDDEHVAAGRLELERRRESGDARSDYHRFYLGRSHGVRAWKRISAAARQPGLSWPPRVDRAAWSILARPRRCGLGRSRPWAHAAGDVRSRPREHTANPAISFRLVSQLGAPGRTGRCHAGLSRGRSSLSVAVDAAEAQRSSRPGEVAPRRATRAGA